MPFGPKIPSLYPISFSNHILLKTGDRVTFRGSSLYYSPSPLSPLFSLVKNWPVQWRLYRIKKDTFLLMSTKIIPDMDIKRAQILVNNHKKCLTETYITKWYISSFPHPQTHLFIKNINLWWRKIWPQQEKTYLEMHSFL